MDVIAFSFHLSNNTTVLILDRGTRQDFQLHENVF